MLKKEIAKSAVLSWNLPPYINNILAIDQSGFPLLLQKALYAYVRMTHPSTTKMDAEIERSPKKAISFW